MATLDFVMDNPAEQRLVDYFDSLGNALQASFFRYLRHGHLVRR
jgi:hypothetical protein